MRERGEMIQVAKIEPQSATLFQSSFGFRAGPENHHMQVDLEAVDVLTRLQDYSRGLCSSSLSASLLG